MPAPIYVHSVGMTTAVGLYAAAASAAMRAGIRRIELLPYLDDDRSPLKGASVPVAPDDTSAEQRRLTLLDHALRDALRRVGLERLARTPLIVALPEGLKPDVHMVRQFTTQLSARCGVPLDPRKVRLLARGSAGAYLAMVTARDQLADGPVIVAAVDSLVRARELQALSRARRLATEKHTDGFIPGEAAACVLLDRAPTGSVGAVLGLGYGEEPGLLDNDIPLRGTGVTEAARRALDEAGLAMHDMDFRLSDYTGESYFFKEQALVVSRLLRKRKEEFPLWGCTNGLGYVGAAAGLCNVAWALESWKRGATPGRHAIAWAGGYGSARASLVLRCGGPK